MLCHQKAAAIRAGDNLVSCFEQRLVEVVPEMVEEGLLGWGSSAAGEEIIDMMRVVEGSGGVGVGIGGGGREKSGV